MCRSPSKPRRSLLPRTCTVCHHPERPAIDLAIVRGEPLRGLGASSGLTASALFRHRSRHLPVALLTSAHAAEIARADDLVEAVRTLGQHAVDVLATAESTGDLRTALAGIREARGCISLLARLLAQRDAAPTVALLTSPEWIALRAVVFEALAPYPEAGLALAFALAKVERGHGT